MVYGMRYKDGLFFLTPYTLYPVPIAKTLVFKNSPKNQKMSFVGIVEY